MSEFFNCFTSPDSGISCIIEDDGRTGYGYLLSNRKIVADVWLYNQMPTPELPEWDDREKAPFLNPAAYVNQDPDFRPLTDPGDVELEWITRDSAVAGAAIFLYRKLHATVLIGEHPGKSRFAGKDGPLAMRMDEKENR